MAIMCVKEVRNVCIQERYGDMRIARSYMGNLVDITNVHNVDDAEGYLRKCVRVFTSRKTEPAIIDGGKLKWIEGDFDWECDDPVITVALKERGW